MSIYRSSKKPRVDHSTRASSQPAVLEEVPSRTVRKSSALRSSSDLDVSFLVAAIENRANEVGVAIFDATRQQLLLTQFIETSRTYTTTLTLLHRYPPKPLILVDEKTKSRAGGLTSAVQDICDHIALPRGCFDDAKAELMIEELAVEGQDSEKHVSIRRRHYLAIGAAGALLSYLQEEKHQVLKHKSLDVIFIGTEKCD